MLKFAVIGMGCLGKVHFANLRRLQEQGGAVELVALCDVEKESFTRLTVSNLEESGEIPDLSAYRLYGDAGEMLEKEDLDCVVTALPTYLHEKIAVMALERGLHVFSEKPMAITLDACQSMLDKAAENKKMLMIGQCLRYWPEYAKLKEYIESGEFGRVIRADFSRLSATPIWSWQNWLLDHEKSGGAAIDLHVHDTDYINHAFGLPEAVSSAATHDVTKFDSIFTTYYYKDMLITASCDWGMPQNFPFTVSFSVRFEKAAVEMRSGKLTVYPRQGEPFTPRLEDKSAYMIELEDFIDCVKRGKTASAVNDPKSAMQTIKLAFLEKEAAEKGGKIDVR